MIKSKFTLIFTILMVPLVAALLCLYMLARNSWDEPMLSSHQVETIFIKRNSNFDQLIDQLSARGWLVHPEVIRWYSRLVMKNRKLCFGEYWLKPGMTLGNLVDNIVNARGMVNHHITFIEGWTFRKLRRALDKDSAIEHDTVGLSGREIMSKLGHTGQQPEGRFFPDTYQFYYGVSDLTILERSYVRMQSLLKQEWLSRDRGLPYVMPYSALIVASLIESEAVVDKDRGKISSVIENRLRRKMPLQIDPTVLYGLNKIYGSPISRKDLKIKTRFNTYTFRGLPPTPINMPGLASIYAALHPVKSHYLYYVAKGDGSHVFSRTFKQHKLAIKKYLLKKRDTKKGVSKGSASPKKHIMMPWFMFSAMIFAWL